MRKQLPYRHRVQVLLFFLILITYLDRVTISLVGVRIKTEFHLSNEQFGWVLGSFALAYALFEIPAGILGDRIGQRKMLLRIVTCWSLFTALTGFTTGLVSLLIVRFCFGIGEAGAFPTASAAVSRWFPAAETARGISSQTLGVNVGAALAPLIVVPIAIALGWRAPFFVNGAIGCIWIIVCYLWFRDDPIEMKHIPIDEINLIHSTRKQPKHHHPFPWKTALRSRNIWALGITFFSSQCGLYFFIAWMPIYLQQGLRFTESNMKTIMTLLFVAGIAGGLAGGIIADRLTRIKGLNFSRRLIGCFALAAMGGCFIAAALTPNRLTATALLILANACFMFYPITAFATCVDIGGRHCGTVAGTMNFFGQLGSFFIGIAFGRIVDKTHNFNTPLLYIAAILIAGSAIWLLVNPSQKLAKEHPEKNPTFSIVPNLIQSS